MNSPARSAVLQFFRDPGARVAVSKSTISRMLSIAYPTLEPVLDALEREGLLERASFDQWRPVRGFDYSGGIRASTLRARARRDAKIAKSGKWEKVREERTRRKEERERLKRELALRRITNQEERCRQLAIAAEERLNELERRKIEHAERKAERAEAAKRAKLEERKKPKAETPATIVAPIVQAPLAPAAAAKPEPVDPWKVIRERTYGRPKYLGSDLRPLTVEERSVRRA